MVFLVCVNKRSERKPLENNQGKKRLSYLFPCGKLYLHIFSFCKKVRIYMFNAAFFYEIYISVRKVDHVLFMRFSLGKRASWKGSRKKKREAIYKPLYYLRLAKCRQTCLATPCSGARSNLIQHFPVFIIIIITCRWKIAVRLSLLLNFPTDCIDVVGR